MQAGKLRHRLTIQQFVETQDSFGQDQKTWSTLATVWGAVEPLSGDRQPERYERIEAQLLAEATTRIRIRYRSGLTHKMRVLWRTHTYDVMHVANIETRDREIHLLCKEQPDG